MISISICLSDLPKDKITTAANGKKYINLICDTRKEPDKFGNTHTVYVSQTKEERAEKKDKKYVGNGKEVVFQKTEVKQTAPEPEDLPETDDIPY